MAKHGTLSITLQQSNPSGPAGITMHSKRHFTEVHLQDYYPLKSMFNHHTRQRMIKSHHRLRHLFQPVPTHYALRWPWQLKSAIDNCASRSHSWNRKSAESHDTRNSMGSPSTSSPDSHQFGYT